MDAEVFRLLMSLTQIAIDEVYRAGRNPGLVAGTLIQPYSDATVTFDSTARSFVVSQRGSKVRTPDVEEAAKMIGNAWREDLMELRQRNPRQYAQAVKFVNDHAPDIEA